APSPMPWRVRRSARPRRRRLTPRWSGRPARSSARNRLAPVRFRPGTSTMLALLGGLVAVTAALPGCGSSSSPPPDYTLGTQGAGPGSGGGRDLFLQAYHLGKGRDPDHSVTLSRSEGALVVRVERGAAIKGIEPDNIY